MSQIEPKERKCLVLPRYYATENVIVKVGVPVMEILVADPEIGNATRVGLSIENLWPILRGCFEYIVLVVDQLLTFYKQIAKKYNELPVKVKDKVSRKEIEEKIDTLEKLVKNVPIGEHMKAILSLVNFLVEMLADPNLEPIIRYYLQKSRLNPLGGVI